MLSFVFVSFLNFFLLLLMCCILCSDHCKIHDRGFEVLVQVDSSFIIYLFILLNEFRSNVLWIRIPC